MKVNLSIKRDSLRWKISMFGNEFTLSGHKKAAEILEDVDIIYQLCLNSFDHEFDKEVDKFKFDIANKVLN